LETVGALHISDPIIGPFGWLGESILFLILIILFITSLFLKRHRVWLLVGLIIFWPIVISTSFLTINFCDPGSSLVLRGLYDRIMHDYTLDDLRHFARDVDKAGILKSGYIDHGDISHLTPEQREAFTQLRKKYSFMRWMDDGRFFNGPSISEDKDIIYVLWGGALEGHWGFSISANGSRNEPHPNFEIDTLRLSDDIYLYYD
jgi:hypothetical protein